ncbi:hypothetical protein ACWKSP_13715 [Micromonosporaceae bacterium Da 78-11]
MRAVLSVRRITTPDLYRLVTVGLLLLGLGAGAVALATERHRSALTSDIVAVSGPLSVGAQDLYRSLSDADATAANAFLTNGVEPAVLRKRYLDDLARASAALTVALRDAGDDDAARLAVLADQLPVYTGLVETARSYNRLGVPLGGAYLREASALMRQTLLPAAQGLLDSAQHRLITAQRDAAGFPLAVLLLGLLTVGALVAAQVLVSRRSNRVFNVGLLAASLVALISLAWATTALGLAARQAEAGHRDGSALVALLTDARRAALQGRADEALTLIARGNGAAFEKDFGLVLADLIGPDGAGGLLGQALAQAPTAADRALIERARGEAWTWSEQHRRVHELDGGGDYLGAVELATDTGPESPSTVFGRLDTAMTDALARTNDRVAQRAEDAGGHLGGLGAGLVLITFGLLTAVVLGFRPRLGEYR